MSPLTFTLKTTPEYPVDVSPITPNNLATRSPSQIRNIRLVYGKDKIKITDLFSVSGKNTEYIKIKNSSKELTHVGHGMTTGRLEADGDVGYCLGRKLYGGHVTVKGNAGSWVGSGMRGGHIDIHGNAGSYIGASQLGATSGMQNGIININGDAGDMVGNNMRSGVILVKGNMGIYCGSRMKAGTIIALGKLGRHIGQGMHRGTIVLAERPRNILPTFKSGGNLKMPFLGLLFTQLSEISTNFKRLKKYNQDAEAELLSGDLACGGKGELIILNAD